MICSTFRVISGRAGAPSLVESFIPLYWGGLCEAVKLIPQIACFVRMTCEIVGVGTGSSHKSTRKALWEITLAHSAANRSPRNLVSYPTTMRFPAVLVFPKWEQIALVTERTLAKVNSSAITARQPDVPNRIVMSIFKSLLNLNVRLATIYLVGRWFEPQWSVLLSSPIRCQSTV